ncbi:hypothetical protein B1A99_04650 [Cohnella sp. CIP 111063]|uniref:sensor histidine kinase n=1 Tax=unclassified Cohnella TaxID=2636738 RepID=UPI000B8BED83|nr:MULTISPECIES: sensor histidine kinase [unclassified Cohnella]OXS61893.1 hypothetical protein B1A99_04650 [Cohnella sp. CIP 111063]PRX74348.1 two-component system sensor histidine kinase YesM [Cohnella sp. SGD-V74]
MKLLVKLFENMLLQRKLIVTYSIVIFIPLLVLGSYAYFQSRVLLERQAVQSIERELDTIESHLAYKMDRYNAIMDIIILNSSTTRILSHDYIDYINLAADLKGYLDPLFKITTLSNAEIRQLTIYPNKSLPRYGNYLLNAESFQYESLIDRNRLINNKIGWYVNTQLKRIEAVRNIPSASSSPSLGFLYMSLDQDQFFAGLEGTVSTPGDLKIIDENGYILFAGTEHAQRSSEESGRHLQLQRLLPVSGWTIQYEMSQKYVLQETESILYTMFLIIGVCILIMLVLSWFFSRTLVRPILYLYTKMDLVKRGDFTVQIRSAARDEIGMLTNQFSDMLARINELIEEVYQHQIKKREAQLIALQAQINPHFLYNTLSIVNWKALQLGSEEISRIVTTMSRFYRKALNKGNNIISVRDELELTKAYIDIQLIMHDHSFEVHYRIEEAICEYDMLNLLLQPLVENAIEHGIDHRREGGGLLLLEGSAKDGTIEIAITDNGPGMEADTLESLRLGKGRGYGIFNTRERIQLLFGPEYGLRIDSRPTEGTRVTVVIPAFRRNS